MLIKVQTTSKAQTPKTTPSEVLSFEDLIYLNNKG